VGLLVDVSRDIVVGAASGLRDGGKVEVMVMSSDIVVTALLRV
jgi:hypothetical protein